MRIVIINFVHFDDITKIRINSLAILIERCVPVCYLEASGAPKGLQTCQGHFWKSSESWAFLRGRKSFWRSFCGRFLLHFKRCNRMESLAKRFLSGGLYLCVLDENKIRNYLFDSKGSGLCSERGPVTK